jgi:hypothetical protein
MEANVQKNELAESLHSVLHNSFINYKGCIIELPEYKVFGKPCGSLKAAMSKIDNAFSSLAKTIR